MSTKPNLIIKNNVQTPKKIVCIGGGTGTFVVLKGLKEHSHALSAIVTMSDSGGSNKRIRDEFGLLPTSDVRQCFVALSDEKGGIGLLRSLFMYRFEKGQGISGMTFGNLFMAALSDIYGSQTEAIKQTHKILRIKGTVIPVSYTHTDLYARYEDGSVLTEEHLIDEPPHDGKMKITDVYLEPKATPNVDALHAIADADLIVLGPGDLYTSLLPNLLVDGIFEAIAASSARKIYVCNLMTKYGQTYGYTAQDHIAQIEKRIGKTLTYVIINSEPFPEAVLRLYKDQFEDPIIDNLTDETYYTVIRAELLNSQIISRAGSDSLVRSLIRHDSEKLARVIHSLI